MFRKKQAWDPDIQKATRESRQAYEENKYRLENLQHENESLSDQVSALQDLVIKLEERIFSLELWQQQMIIWSSQFDEQDSDHEDGPEEEEEEVDIDSCYEELGLSPGASKSEIKAAYRSLAKKSHPDAGGDEDEFMRIKRAYEICLEDAA